MTNEELLQIIEQAASEKETVLHLDNNPQLRSPPPEIVEQGTEAILTYLRARLEAKG